LDAASAFVVFWIYSLFVYFLKDWLYPWNLASGPLPRESWAAGQEHSLFVSPDYWWARRFKLRLSAAAPLEQRAALLKAYVVSNNRANIWFSLALAVVCVTSKTIAPTSAIFLMAATAAVIRFASRSYEITYAFVRDVFQTTTASTGLSKEERVRLALTSYLEIYLYSAAAYTVLPTPAPYDALTLALNVGTLTNVGYAYSAVPNSFAVNMVFVQVISTLSLVVLSLAAYLGRDK
jgi:hypothetical protein